MSTELRSWTFSAGSVDLRATHPSNNRKLEFDALPQEVILDLERTAVIVVDMQNDFCTPGGWLDSIGVDTSAARSAVPAIQTLLPRFRAAQVPVIWLNWGNRPDQANLPPGVRHVYDPEGTGHGIGSAIAASPAVLIKDSWGADIISQLVTESTDLFIDKYRMSGFVDTPLDSILRQRRIDTLIFAGVNADQCVLATLTDAACLGYDVIYVEDACATTSPEYCLQSTVYNVRQCYGFTTTEAALTAAFTKKASPSND